MALGSGDWFEKMLVKKANEWMKIDVPLRADGDTLTSFKQEPTPSLTSNMIKEMTRRVSCLPPRLVPVEPLICIEIYTGHEVLHVYEDNPAYLLIPPGTAMLVKGPRPASSWQEEAIWPARYTLSFDVPTYYLRREDYERVRREIPAPSSDDFRRQYLGTFP